MPNTERKKINLAIQGGGARGAFVWGILDKFLEDDRLEIEGISATSAGSLNAVVLSQGLMEGGPERARELLSEFWKRISDEGKIFNPTVFTPLDYLFAPYLKQPFSFCLFSNIINLFSPYQFNPYNFNLLELILKDIIDFDKLKTDNPIHLFICATNVKTGKLHLFQNKELSLNAVLASACLPYLFQAVEIDNEYYWDGGYLGNPAIFPLIYHCKSQDIIVLHTSPVKRTRLPTDAFDISHRVSEISFNASLMREMRVIAFITKMIENNCIKDEAKDRFKKIFMHSLESDDVLQDLVDTMSRYNTDWVFLDKLFRLGRKMATKWLEENYESIGEKTTIDFDDWM